MMTDWGVHWLDIVQMAFDEKMPTAAVALGGKFWLNDNRETPDIIQVTYEYPGFIATYENRTGHSQSIHGSGSGILFQGTKATMFVDRSRYAIIPERNSAVEPMEVKASDSGNARHWANFLDCVKTRNKPNSDIGICHKSTSTCHLGNIALRSKLRVDYDPARETIAQADARKYLSRDYRKPWKLAV
jgi:predicted dehydrogenase